MKRFLRTLLTLALAIALVFTMSVPAFAVEKQVPKYPGGKVYLAFGDSIGAGTKETFNDVYRTSWSNLPEGKLKRYYEQFNNFININDDGTKSQNVYAVETSYVYQLSNMIKADQDKSCNAAMNGLRARDICWFLDIVDELEKGDYNDGWAKAMGFDKYQSNKDNISTLKEKIETADVITIELGQNDLTSLVLDDELTGSITEGIGGLTANSEIITDFVDHLKALFLDDSNYKDKIKNLKDVASDLKKIKELGGDIEKILSPFLETVKKNQYYFTSLMKYIQENKKGDAVVLVSTMINPFHTTEDTPVEYKALIDQYLSKVEPIVDTLIKGINTLIKAEALTYGYYVADISDVILFPGPDIYVNDEGSEMKATYSLHPNDADQTKIANRFYSEFNKAQLIKAAEAIAAFVAVNVAEKKDAAEAEKTPVTEQPTEVKQDEPVVTETVEEQKLTDEDVIADLSDATLRCTTEKTSKGIKVTAKVTDADLDAMNEAGYTVAYKFYRSTKKSSGYKYMLTSTTGKYTNTSVKKGNKYYYKTKLVVTDAEGNEVTKSVLKDCKYGARTF